LLSLALVSRSQKLLLAATSDTLTGLFNRGYFEERFAIELSRSGRYGHPLTLAVIDADRFKSLNDNHGHSAGDMVLRKVAELLRDSCRQSDTAARYGGEEFVVLLPETDIEAARQKVESLRELVASTAFALSRSRGDQTVQVTISAGLATFPQDGSDERELFAAADERMFQAKKEGRNRVIASSEPVLTEH
jgi:diguanylate cyclase